MKTFKFRLTSQAWWHMLVVPTETEESLEARSSRPDSGMRGLCFFKKIRLVRWQQVLAWQAWQSESDYPESTWRKESPNSFKWSRLHTYTQEINKCLKCLRM